MTTPLSPDLNQIAKLLDRSRPQVVIVVGAGVTISGTGQPHASWLGLLRHGVQHLVARDRFTKKYGDQLDSSLNRAFSPFGLKDALNHAETVEQILNTPDEKAFAEWLESAFSNLMIRDDEKATALLESLRDLHEAGALLLTTNYDSLLTKITNSPAVTWEEHADFHRVMTRQKAAILHIHGHWQRPSSVVLGNKSYNRVVSDVDFQQLLRTLWLEWTWIYVGCGNGFDDPNLGRLMEWSNGWGVSALPDFFLAREDRAKEIAVRPSKPPNLISIGYKSHDDLAGILRSVTPAARCWPFVRVDDEFSLFHVPRANDPFPTREEYLKGDVPTLAADAEVQKRLQEYGWACCIDVASVGKTTLALRVATTPEQRAHPVFYLDLKKIFPDDVDASPVEAAHRLARPGTLLILDNIQHQPELAREIWHQFSAQPFDRRGRLLLIGTRIHQPVVVTPEQDLTFFESHSLNPAILVQPTSADLGRLVKHLYQRVGGAKRAPMPEPPSEALTEWHRNYRAALNAFTFAVLDSLADLQTGQWSLRPSRASAWVRKHWLNKLDAQELENTICLSVFGAQELELSVQDEALPFPSKTQKLFELGLVAQIERGQLKQYRQFELREPGWGVLILAALTPPVNEEQTLFATASRQLTTLIILSSRLQRDRDFDCLQRLWKYIAPKTNNLLRQIWHLPLPYIPELARWAEVGGQPQLVTSFLQVIEEDPQAFATRARQTSLQDVGYYLEGAWRYKRDIEPLWSALLGKPEDLDHKSKLAQLVKTAWARPVGCVGSFLEVARRHERDIAPLWDALIGKHGDPDREAKLAEFVNAAWATSLESITSFLVVVKRHDRDTAPLWDALIGNRGDPDHETKLTEFINAAWATSLVGIGLFLEVAKRHERETAPLWDALIGKHGDLDREVKLAEFVKVAWAASLGTLGSFLELAARHERDTASLWDALLGKREDPVSEVKLAEFVNAAWATSLEGIGLFLEVAKRHERDTVLLWDALIGKQGDLDREAKLAEFVKVAWATSLGTLGSFLELAARHERDTASLWDALLSKPDSEVKLAKFVNAAWATSLDGIGSFFEVVKRHERDTAPLWDALLGKPDDPDLEAKLAEFVNAAWATSLEGIGSFLEVAKRHDRDTAPLWDSLLGKREEPKPERKIDHFLKAVRETSLSSVGSFLEVAQRHNRDTTSLWDALIGKSGDPNQEAKLAEFVKLAWTNSLESVASFLDVANHHGRDTELWDVLLGKVEEQQEAKLAEFVKIAWMNSLEKVGSFLDVAKDHGRDTTQLWDALLGKEGEPHQATLDQFIKAAWATPRLDCIGSFINCARQQGRDIDQLEQALASNQDLLATKGKDAEVNDLVGFAHYINNSLFEIAVRDIKLGHWDALSPTERMNGASWLVLKFADVNRNDLAADLATLLLRRSNWQDFHPQSGGFNQLSRFLANVPITASELVEPFCQAICTAKWLRVVYVVSTCGQLASGLRLLALYQTVERCRQFHYKGLGGRLNKELARFQSATSTDQSQIIQLLGSAGLCGWAISYRNLSGIRLNSVSQLPLNVPHRVDATKIESYQLQLWLGLRNFVSIRRVRLFLPLEPLEKTLTLWRTNLEETSQTPTSVAHRINLSMIKWLEDCCRAIPPALLPNTEPLWTLSGFPLVLDLPNTSVRHDRLPT